jgi:hypothetical protein
MVPPLVCSRIKYSFVRSVIIDDYPLGNVPIFNGHASENVLLVLQQAIFDDTALSLMEYEHTIPFNGFYVIVH